MDDRIKRLDTPKKCEIFARNETNHSQPDLAREANRCAKSVYSWSWVFSYVVGDYGGGENPSSRRESVKVLCVVDHSEGRIED